ncbi:MAG: MmgE/PrpD family protein [Egibacteraceae bacterium]
MVRTPSASPGRPGKDSERLIGFIHDLTAADLPSSVLAQARLHLLDLLGVAAGGLHTPVSAIIRDHAARYLAAREGGARMLFDGRRVSPMGAALAGGTTIDSLDGHDGYPLAKGHAGAAVLPALLAFVDAGAGVSGPQLLTTLVVGYEIALRAGIALHATAADYHSSGAWNALGCAAVGARLLRLGEAETRHALGIADYHGPRSPMMRCIDHPTMVKDGSGWGAMVGVSAVLLAADGFTGAPAATVEDPGNLVRSLWDDLGTRWRTLEQYFKPYPVCRWAHPAIDAALMLRDRHDLEAEGAIAGAEIVTFHQAVRLATRRPRTTEEAQYSLPFTVAAALARGVVGSRELAADALEDGAILRLSDVIMIRESAAYEARASASQEYCAQVSLQLADGRQLVAEATSRRGDPSTPLTDQELTDKFRDLARPLLGLARSDRLEVETAALEHGGDPARLLANILEPA